MTAAALGLERSETTVAALREFSLACLFAVAFELTAPAGNQVVNQDDHCDHYQDVNQVSTEVTDESE